MFADLEWGLFQGSATNGTTNISLSHRYVSGFLKGDSKTYAIRANDATQDVLKVMGAGNRPTAWVTGILTGAIILGIGGDSSPSGKGTFFEGAMTIGRPSDSTENAIQKNLSIVYGKKDTVTTGVVNRQITTSKALKPWARYNSSNGNTVISYFLPEAQRVSLKIVNSQGKLITTIASGVKPAGRNETVWSSKSVTAGVYILSLILDGKEHEAGQIIVGK
jgi:hypothetical protein